MLEPRAACRLLSELDTDLNASLAERLDAGHFPHLPRTYPWPKDQFQRVRLLSLQQFILFVGHLAMVYDRAIFGNRTYDRFVNAH